MKKGKAPSKSRVEMIQQVLPSDTNPIGSVFGGRVMDWIDVAGAVAAMRHTEGLVVTASFDRVDFHAPAYSGHIMELVGIVTYAGKTSIEVEVNVVAENPLSGERHQTTSALITFVGIDDEGNPKEVIPVVPETEDEKRRYKLGERRRQRRIAERQEDAQTT